MSQNYIKPLERMNVVHDEKTIVNQIQSLLLVEDDDIFDEQEEEEEEEEEEEDYTDLPAVQLKRTDSISSEFSQIQYVNSVRKNRPLPKIPDRVSSKEVSSNMTALLNESFRNQKKISAQELFQLLKQNNAPEQAAEEEGEETDDNVYGGVYALKTQLPSPTLTNKEALKQYYDDIANNYKMMTPVEEVDEEQLIMETNQPNDMEQDEEREENTEQLNTYTLQPDTPESTRPLSQVSLQAPSLTSGRTSPTSSHNSRQSEELNDPPLDLELDFQTPKQASAMLPGNMMPQHTEEQWHFSTSQNKEPMIPPDATMQSPPNKFDTITGISAMYETPTDGYSYGGPQPMQEPVPVANDGYLAPQNPNSNRDSLFGDVQKLSQLNQALMTPEIPNSTVPTVPQQSLDRNSMSSLPSRLSQSSSVSPYENMGTKGTRASSSLLHDKESIKTYRRMATKTNDRNIQFTYARYLMQLVALYVGTNDPAIIAVRDRLQEEAEYWVDKLAKSCYPAALYTKGQWLRHCGDAKAAGIFVGPQYKKVNHTKAFKCFQQAAKYGSVEAYYELAEYWMVRKDYRKSIECYKYAASKKHILSLYKLANIMIRGLLHQEKDIQQGLVYLKQAADSEKPECARSAYDLGCILSSDLKSIDLEHEPSITNFYMTPNPTSAIHYFRKADQFGLINATYRLGMIYNQASRDNPSNTWEAYKRFARCAEHSNEDAMIELAQFYRNGISGYLSPQPLLAFQWCHKATENGNPMADYILGTFYESGVGVYPDHTKAMEWFKKSAAKRYRPAEERLHISRHSSLQPLPPPVCKSQDNAARPKQYYEESVRIAEKSRRTHAEQNCQIM